MTVADVFPSLDPSEVPEEKLEAVRVATPTDDAAVLAQERAAAEQALPESISPSLYDDDGVLVPRVFKDQTAALAKNAGPRVSRFSTIHLNDLEAALAGLYRHTGGAYGFYYDARRDTVIIEGNLDVNLLPAEALANGEITFTYTADGERQSRTGGSAPRGNRAGIKMGTLAVKGRRQGAVGAHRSGNSLSRASGTCGAQRDLTVLPINVGLPLNVQGVQDRPMARHDRSAAENDVPSSSRR